MHQNGGRLGSSHTYHLYGLCVQSQWPLPYVECTEAGPSAVELVEGSALLFEKASREAASQLNAAEWYHHASLRDGSIYLRWSELFEFLVSADGSRIVGRPVTDVSSEAFHTYLLGVVLSFSLLKRGFDPLHATTVVVNGGAVGFLGDTGYGKSSLAGAFIQAGYPMLTDDLLVMKEEEHGFFAFSGPPRIKLFPEIARSLLGEQVTGILMNPLTHKLIIPLDHHQSHQAAVPVKALYVLTRPAAGARSERITIRRLSPRRAFLALLKNAFNTDVIESERLKRQFALATSIASNVPIKLLSYPRTLTVLPSVRDAILSDLTR